MSPRKLSFAVMKSPSWMGGNDCAIYFSEAITDARPGVPSSQCWVVGMDMVRGRIVKWNCPVTDFQAAMRAPVTFVEVDTMRAPTGILGPGNLPRVLGAAR